MSDESNSNQSGLKLLAGILSASVVIVTLLGLGIFGAVLLTASLNPPDATAEAPAPVQAAAPAPAATSAAAAAPSTGAAPVDASLLADGKATYNTLCIACHGPDAKGMPNNMAPALAGSDIVNGSTERLAMLTLNGIQPEGRYLGVMVSWKPILDDRKMAGVLSYIRSNFGNSAPGITPEQMSWAREKYKETVTPFLRDDLDKVTDDLPTKP